jgi:hypothetical protein
MPSAHRLPTGSRAIALADAAEAATAGLPASTMERSPKRIDSVAAVCVPGTGALASARASVFGTLPASFRSMRPAPSCCAAIFSVCLMRPTRGAHLSNRWPEGITLRLFRGASRPQESSPPDGDTYPRRRAPRLPSVSNDAARCPRFVLRDHAAPQTRRLERVAGAGIIVLISVQK